MNYIKLCFSNEIILFIINYLEILTQNLNIKYFASILMTCGFICEVFSYIYIYLLIFTCIFIQFYNFLLIFIYIFIYFS